MSTAMPPSPLAVAAAFAAIYLLWGSNFLAIRIAVETIPPFLLMGARSLVAGIILLGWALAREGRRPRRQHWYGAAGVGTLLFLVGHGGLAWAQQHVPSGVAALLMATIPLWMVLLEWRLLGAARPGAATWAGLALGLAGIALLVGPGPAGATATPLGPALVLMASAFGWAAGSIGSRLVPAPPSVAAATGQQLVVGGILLLAVAAAAGELSQAPAVSGRSLLAMAYMVVAASLVSFTAYVWLLRVSTPGRVSSYAFVNPVVAVFVGWALGGEAVTPRTLVAAAVIVLGVVLIVTTRSRTARA
jgi:drug/metabolite transporter (DMT)-like permease